MTAEGLPHLMPCPRCPPGRPSIRRPGGHRQDREHQRGNSRCPDSAPAQQSLPRVTTPEYHGRPGRADRRIGMPTHSIGIGRTNRADHLFVRSCSRSADVAGRGGCWCLSLGAPGGVVTVMGEARRLLPPPPCALGGHPCQLRAAGAVTKVEAERFRACCPGCSATSRRRCPAAITTILPASDWSGGGSSSGSGSARTGRARTWQSAQAPARRRVPACR